MNALYVSDLLIVLGVISAILSVLVMNKIVGSRASITRISLARKFNLFMLFLFSLNFLMFIGFLLEVFIRSILDIIAVLSYIIVSDIFLVYIYLIIRK